MVELLSVWVWSGGMPWRGYVHTGHVHTGHVAWVRHVFQSTDIWGAVFYSNQTKPSLTEISGTRELEYYSRTTFIGNLNLTAQFWRRGLELRKLNKTSFPCSPKWAICVSCLILHQKDSMIFPILWVNVSLSLSGGSWSCYNLMFRISNCSKCTWSIRRVIKRVKNWASSDKNCNINPYLIIIS